MEQLFNWLEVSCNETITCTISCDLFAATFDIINPEAVIRENVIFVTGDNTGEVHFDENSNVNTWTDGISIYYEILSDNITITFW